MSAANRFRECIERCGEVFTISSVEYMGIVQSLDSTRMRTYLDDVEISGVVKPGLVITAAPSVPLTVGAEITRDGRTFKVLKVFSHRIFGEVVLQVAVLS